MPPQRRVELADVDRVGQRDAIGNAADGAAADVDLVGGGVDRAGAKRDRIGEAGRAGAWPMAVELVPDAMAPWPSAVELAPDAFDPLPSEVAPAPVAWAWLPTATACAPVALAFQPKDCEPAPEATASPPMAVDGSRWRWPCRRTRPNPVGRLGAVADGDGLQSSGIGVDAHRRRTFALGIGTECLRKFLPAQWPGRLRQSRLRPGPFGRPGAHRGRIAARCFRTAADRGRADRRRDQRGTDRGGVIALDIGDVAERRRIAALGIRKPSDCRRQSPPPRPSAWALAAPQVTGVDGRGGARVFRSRCARDFADLFRPRPGWTVPKSCPARLRSQSEK